MADAAVDDVAEELHALALELLDGPVGGGAESIFAEAAAAARAVLAKATINDVVERENRDAGASMYYI